MTRIASIATLTLALIAASASAQKVLKVKTVKAVDGVEVEVDEQIEAIADTEGREIDLTILSNVKAITNANGEQVIELRSADGRERTVRTLVAKAVEPKSPRQPGAVATPARTAPKPGETIAIIVNDGESATVLKGGDAGRIQLPAELPEQVRTRIQAAVAQAQAQAEAAMKQVEQQLAATEAQQKALGKRLQESISEALAWVEADTEVKAPEATPPGAGTGVEAKLDLILQRLSQLEERVAAIESE